MKESAKNCSQQVIMHWSPLVKWNKMNQIQKVCISNSLLQFVFLRVHVSNCIPVPLLGTPVYLEQST